MAGSTVIEKKGRALIRGEMLKWAREATRLDLASAARAASIKNPETFHKAEIGETLITFRQLRAFARSCKIPLSTFYLPQPPTGEPLPIDFRSAKHDGEYSPELIKALRVARARRDAALELFDEAGITLPVLPSADSDAKIESEIGRSLCAPRWVELDVQPPKKLDDGAKSLSLSKELVERAFPVLVFEFNIDTADVRGCSLYDERLSVIILSSGDSPNAKRFTLAHELAHLFLRESGACSPLRARLDDAVERRCNNIAGESLAPASLVKEVLSGWTRDTSTVDSAIDKLRRKFRLSHSAVAVRLGQLGVLSPDEVREKLELYRRMWQERRETPEGENKRGPHAYVTQVQRLGPTFAAAVLSGMDNDRLSVTQAADLLGVAPSYSNIGTLREKLVTIYGH